MYKRSHMHLALVRALSPHRHAYVYSLATATTATHSQSSSTVLALASVMCWCGSCTASYISTTTLPSEEKKMIPESFFYLPPVLRAGTGARVPVRCRAVLPSTECSHAWQQVVPVPVVRIPPRGELLRNLGQLVADADLLRAFLGKPHRGFAVL